MFSPTLSITPTLFLLIAWLLLQLELLHFKKKLQIFIPCCKGPCKPRLNTFKPKYMSESHCKLLDTPVRVPLGIIAVKTSFVITAVTTGFIGMVVMTNLVVTVIKPNVTTNIVLTLQQSWS